MSNGFVSTSAFAIFFTSLIFLFFCQQLLFPEKNNTFLLIFFFFGLFLLLLCYKRLQLMRWNAHHLGQPVLQSSVLLESEGDLLPSGELLDFALDNENEFVLRVEPSEKSPEINDAHIYQVCIEHGPSVYHQRARLPAPRRKRTQVPCYIFFSLFSFFNTLLFSIFFFLPHLRTLRFNAVAPQA